MSNKFSLILDFLTKRVKTRKRPLGKLNRKTGKIHIEFVHHICHMQKPEDASGRDARIKLISVSLKITKIRTFEISLENIEVLL